MFRAFLHCLVILAACAMLLSPSLLPADDGQTGGQIGGQTGQNNAPAESADTPQGPGESLRDRFDVLSMRIDAGISPIQAETLEKAVHDCRARGCGLLLIQLDTPGGMAQSMREMVQTIANAPMPVAVWVGPSGAMAASAGAFLVAASDVAGMAPGTTMGSASPVEMSGGDMSETMARKVQNDMVSLMESLAKNRGRNAKWYAEAVTRSASLSAENAVMNNVVEYLARTPMDFLVQAGVRGVPFHGQKIRFAQEQINLREYDPGFRYSFLSWLVDPSIAYFLLLGGLAGLFFELSTPGAVLPGVIGSICLILALYALSVLPTNAAGLLLLLLGMVFFLLEIKIVSHGLLSVAGLAAFFIGSTMLFRFELGESGLPLSTIIVTSMGLSLAMGGGAYLVIKAQRGAKNLGYDALIGLIGVVRTWEAGRGSILVRGEIWSAVLDGRDRETPLVLSEGDRVRVVGHEGLILHVEPTPGD